jgi:trimethylamine--corrinoid protein Co-methyltransferase
VIKIADSLHQYDAQSTALVCSDIPKEIGDLYRLYLVLLHSKKPVVTGAFSSKNTSIMIDMLAIFAEGCDALVQKPTAVFDVCPTPPLTWTHFGSQNLIDLARAGIPAQIVSMPLAGAAAPITLLGCVVQHAAECISGMTIHQLAHPGSPIVWGGAPAIMDMRHGTTPMGAIETAMIDAAYAQVGKFFNFPTHTYLCASDAKVVDYQAGMESSTTALIGALAGINMISGAGMLDFLACISPEKLVIDAQAIGMAKYLLKGMQVHTDPLAVGLYEGINFKGEFLRQPLTRQLTKEEQVMPSSVIDRGSINTWQQMGETDTFSRAKTQVQEILTEYQPPDLPAEKVSELKKFVASLAIDAGMDQLPEFKR